MTADPLASAKEPRERFLALVNELRPELHRYCARMTGSVLDGEDVVQDTLARAYFALPELEALPPLRAWIFHIAHNRALDFLRRYDRRMSEPLETVREEVPGADAADDALARDEAIRLAVSRFVELVPLQRSCVILKDVLGHSAEEIASLLALSVPAVRAALHRGRTRLRELAKDEHEPDLSASRVSPTIARYAALFNARDWDAVRAMLAEDVRLDVVSRIQRSGRGGVEKYFGNYAAKTGGWRVVPSWLDDREVLALYLREDDRRPHHVVLLTTDGGEVKQIRDYGHVDYLLAEARVWPASAS
jgi:RNA polymerase sigma-70 factor (ECF subfamily)